MAAGKGNIGMSRWSEHVGKIMADTFSVEFGQNREERKARARRDFAYFAQTYFPHICTSPCAAFHIEAANYILKHRNARALFKWPRGHAKSAMLSLIVPLWLLIQERREVHLMVLASKSQEAAEKLLDGIRSEIAGNALLSGDFGIAPSAASWSGNSFKTTDGVMFVAVGRGQSPRGLRNGPYRPDYIIWDDLDDDELVLSSARVSKAVDWLLTALYGTTAAGRGRFIGVGNLIGRDSILARVEQIPEFHVSTVYAIDNGVPVWPENYTLAEFDSMRRTMGERRFQKEMMHNPTADGAIFKQKDIRYGTMLPLEKYRSLVCYTDPSFKNSTKADYKATVLLGRTRTGVIHVLKVYAERASVARMIEWHYLIDAWVGGRAAILFYIEANFIQDMMLEEFRKAGAACGRHIPVRGDTRKKPDKFARIEAIQPFFERGLVILNEAEKDSDGMRVLVDQLLMFDRGSRANDDAPDALEGGINKLFRGSALQNATYISGSRPSRRY